MDKDRERSEVAQWQQKPIQGQMKAARLLYRQASQDQEQQAETRHKATRPNGKKADPMLRRRATQCAGRTTPTTGTTPKRGGDNDLRRGTTPTGGPMMRETTKTGGEDNRNGGEGPATNKKANTEGRRQKPTRQVLARPHRVFDTGNNAPKMLR